MEKNEEKKKEENAKTKTTVAKTGKRKVSKTWEVPSSLYMGSYAAVKGKSDCK